MSVNTQLETMFAMIVMGVWLGLALDTYNRFLQRPNRTRFIVFINDILFWLLQGLITFYILLLVNKGELRFHIFLAILCGYAAYQSLFQTIYLKLLEMLIRIFTALYRFFIRTCYYVIVRPIQWLFHLILLLLLFLWKVFLSVFKTLFRCITLLLRPFRLLGKWIWEMVPFKWRAPVTKFFLWLAGVVQKGTNMFIKWGAKFRK
ncbi:spore cortex biosynthesis protein YabQ [Anoxybacteroides tepidamans]|uniref:spore cortex biosynthesis protein YabQ n=1 Tax=Anoxybacteroides tepidamans TaxID=265948 RepID=UPI0004873444|nr:spore cortex biosynthesis protein YabQ [Anoxybacillus tepidamans]